MCFFCVEGPSGIGNGEKIFQPRSVRPRNVNVRVLFSYEIVCLFDKYLIMFIINSVETILC